MDYANLDQNSNRRGFKAKLLILASVLVIGTVAALAIGLASNHSSLPDNTITQLADPQLGYKLDLFDQWKTHHYKLYKEEEEAFRFTIWSANYDKVQEHHKNPKHTYTIELNEFADLSPQEWKEKIGYCHLNKPITRRHYAKLDSVNIPTAVDWRKKGAVTDVKNQLECGSCWAFSSTGALEGLNFILNGKLRSFSEQQLVDCSQNYGNNGCNGGLMDYAFEYVADKGIETEEVYPYRAKTGLCKYHQDKTVFSNKAYQDVPQGNNDALLAAVAQQPVSIGIEADTSVFQLYAGGVFNDASCGTNIDHGVLIVGFGTDPHGGDYWIVKNSWGGSWGENGYIRIARQSGTGAGVCGIAEAASYPTGQNKDAIDSLSKLLDIGKMNVNDIAPETGSLKDLFEGTPIAVHAINPIIPEVEEGSEEHAEEGAEEHAEEHAEEAAEEGAEEHAEEAAEEGAEEHAEETEFDEIFVLSDVGDRRINPIIPFLEEEAHAEEGAEANEEASEEENHEAENHEAESHEEESHEEEAEIHPHRKQGLAELLDAVQGHGL